MFKFTSYIEVKFIKVFQRKVQFPNIKCGVEVNIVLENTKRSGNGKYDEKGSTNDSNNLF
jgi:hypothetical protein